MTTQFVNPMAYASGLQPVGRDPTWVALIFSGVAVTRHMLAVLVQVRCA